MLTFWYKKVRTFSVDFNQTESDIMTVHFNPCLWLDYSGYYVDIEHIKDLKVTIAEEQLSVLWLRQLLNQYSEIIVTLITCLNTQRKTTGDPELSHYNFAMLFSYTIKNNIKPKNI